MAEYIERGALIKKIFPYDAVDQKAYSINAKAVYEEIRKAPTIDAVEVVRCKDCRHYGRKYGDIDNSYCCHTKQSGYCDKDHFCSYGERREK